MPRKNKIVVTPNYEIVSGVLLDPESINGPIGSTERIDRRCRSSKHFQVGPSEFIGMFFGGDADIHYKENYDDLTEPWKDIDCEYYTEEVDHFLYSKLPYVVRIWKHKYGYEIVERETGIISSVELLAIDDTPIVNAKPKLSKIKFKCVVGSSGVRFWKETKHGGPRKFKWKINISDNNGGYKFREKPEAFETLEPGKDIKVNVKKESVRGGFLWTEEVNRTGVTIDTDFQREATNFFVGGLNSVYATSRSTYAQSGDGFLYVGQSKAINYEVYRSCFSFDTSAVRASGTVTQVNLKLKIKTGGTHIDTNDFDIQIVDYIHDNVKSDVSYDGILAGTADSSIWRNTSGAAENTFYTSGNLNTAWINKSGITFYSLRSSRDLNANTPTDLEYVRLDETAASVILVMAYTQGGWTTGQFMGADVDELLGYVPDQFLGF